MQNESEATLNLLLASRHINRRLSVAQTEAIQRIVDELPWKSGTSKSVYQQMATASLRKALSTPEGIEAYLQQQVAQFKTAERRQKALEQLLSVLNADGLDETERAFQERMTALMG